MERAIEIINEKNEDDRKKVISDFGEIRVLNGRYGPYWQKISRTTGSEGNRCGEAYKEDCIKIIEKNDKTKKSS